MWYHSVIHRAMQNGTLFQYFPGTTPMTEVLWKKLAAEAPRLAEMGFTSIWLRLPVGHERYLFQRIDIISLRPGRVRSENSFGQNMGRSGVHGRDKGGP